MPSSISHNKKLLCLQNDDVMIEIRHQGSGMMKSSDKLKNFFIDSASNTSRDFESLKIDHLYENTNGDTIHIVGSETVNGPGRIKTVLFIDQLDRRYYENGQILFPQCFDEGPEYSNLIKTIATLKYDRNKYRIQVKDNEISVGIYVSNDTPQVEGTSVPMVNNSTTIPLIVPTVYKTLDLDFTSINNNVRCGLAVQTKDGNQTFLTGTLVSLQETIENLKENGEMMVTKHLPRFFTHLHHNHVGSFSPDGEIAIYDRSGTRVVTTEAEIFPAEETPVLGKADRKEQYACHGLDTQEQVFFYEHDFYVFSNFSSFSVEMWGEVFPTTEHAYHWRRFAMAGNAVSNKVATEVLNARSAHDAYVIAQRAKDSLQYSGWDNVKIANMELILRTKVDQHEYVLKKLLATGDRELVEDSWRDSFWGWGPNKDGRNELGKCWMRIRDWYRKKIALEQKIEALETEARELGLSISTVRYTPED